MARLYLFIAVVAILPFLAAAAFLPAQQPAQRVTFEGQQVLRFSLPASAELERAKLDAWIEANRLDKWAEHPDWVDVRLHKSLLPEVAALGMPYYVMVPDLEADIQGERAHIEAVRSQRDASFFDTYRTYDEHMAFLDQLAATYPALVTKKPIGKTIEGRNINGIAITAGNNPNKKRIVFNGGQHAREWIGPMTVQYIADQLLSLYGKDAQVTRFLNEIEWSIFPLINADGYTYSWSTNRMWRKNRRQNLDSWFNCYGVDTNRNWDFHWGEGGASPDTCSETYRGPRAFSEPEETALANYIKSLSNVKGYIDWHSYSQLFLGPWGWSTTILPPDAKIQNDLAREAVAAIKSVHGLNYAYGPSGPTLYITSGGSNDYTYGALNVTFSYTVELRDTGRYGFILPADQIVPTGQESFAAVRVFGDYVLRN